MPGSELGPDDGTEGVTPNPLDALGKGSGRAAKLLASRAGSHGALAGGGAAAERERICVNDAGSDGGAAGVLGALLPAPLNAPNICVSEGCGVLDDGTGPPESARSRSSAGSFANSDVNPPEEGAEEAAGAAANGEAGAGGNIGTDGVTGAVGGAIENDAVAVGSGGGAGAGAETGTGVTGAELAAAPPNAANDPVADRRNAAVADSGLAEGAGVLGVSEVAATVLKSAVNPPAEGSGAGAGGITGAAAGTDAGGAAAAPPKEPKTCVNDPGCDGCCETGCAATAGNTGSGSRAGGVTGALGGAETLPKSSVNPPDPPEPDPDPEPGAAAGVAAAGVAGATENEAVAPPAPELAGAAAGRV